MKNRKDHDLTEGEMISGCVRGKPKAQRQLVDQYSSYLMGICVRYLRDKDWAKDALQESYILIFRNIHRYEPIGSFKGWIGRITVTTCLKLLRTRKRDLDYNAIVDHECIIEPAIIQKLNADDIMTILDTLPEQHRLIVNLYIIEGYNHSEIAEILNIKESSSRSKLTRARKQLKNIFSKKNQFILL